MFLRKSFVAIGPLLLCLLLCVLFRWLDAFLAADRFLPYLLKGLLLGTALGLVLPVGGIATRSNGLTGYLFVAAGLLGVTLLMQYLQVTGAMRLAVLEAVIGVNGQVVLVESTVAAFCTLTAALHRKRRA